MKTVITLLAFMVLALIGNSQTIITEKAGNLTVQFTQTDNQKVMDKVIDITVEARANTEVHYYGEDQEYVYSIEYSTGGYTVKFTNGITKNELVYESTRVADVRKFIKEDYRLIE